MKESYIGLWQSKMFPRLILLVYGVEGNAFKVFYVGGEHTGFGMIYSPTLFKTFTKIESK